MEIDLAHAGSDTGRLAETLRSQVCIVGGGIAGLLTAHRLVHAGVRVTLLEAGGWTRTEADGADPFRAEWHGRAHAGTRKGRVCALGGCSLTWGGQLLPLPQDADWPVSHSELSPFEAAAERLFGVDDLPYNASELFLKADSPLPPLLSAIGGSAVASKFIPFGRRNLGSTVGREVAAHRLATVVLQAPVVEFAMADSGDSICAAVLRTSTGGTIRVEAEQFVLAAGTVETCRLLLASRSVAPQGIGNDEGRVGASFQDHLTLGAAVFTGPARDRMLRELGPRIFASSADATVHSVKLTGATTASELRVHPGMAHVTVEEPEGSGPALIRELLRSRQRGGLPGALRAHAARLPGALVDAVRFGWSAGVRGRRYVSPGATVRLQMNMAQDRDTRSRICLSDEADERGLLRAKIDWEISRPELCGLRAFAAQLRELLRIAGVEQGAIWEPALFDPEPGSEDRLLELIDDARHAMGGACMGTDPRDSVVDPELRVHGVGNLSVASAAVFPDGSPQLPTLTLAALALRLADRLARQLG